MNPLAKAFLAGQGGGGSSGGGGAGLNALGGSGYCLGWVQNNSNNWPFIDVMKNGSYTLNGYTPDANGWPTGIANSGTVEFVVTNIGALGKPFASFPPGNYKARVTQAGWQVQFTNCTGLTNITPQAVGSAFCTAPDLGDTGTNVVMKVTCQAPASGGPHTLTTLQVYLGSSEALLDAGNIVAPVWKADVAGAKALRFKDWMGIDGQMRRNAAYSEVTKATYRVWGHSTNGLPGTNVPYAICAQVAKECGAGMFISGSLMDHGVTYQANASTDVFSVVGVRYDDFTTPIYLDFANGDEIVFAQYGTSSIIAPTPAGGLTYFTRYFVRDVVAPTGSPPSGGSFKVAATLGGTAINITSAPVFQGSDQSNPLAVKLHTSAQYQSFYNSLMQEIASVYPNCPVIVSDVGNENWNAAGPYGYHQCAEVVAVRAALDNVNASPGNGYDGYMYALQRMWTAVESNFPRANHVRMVSGQWSYAASGQHSGMYNYHDPAYFGGAKMANLIDAHCCAGYLYPNLTGGTTPNNLTANGAFGHDFWPELVFNENWASGDNWGTGLVNYLLNDVVHMPSGVNYRCILAHNTSGATMPPNATYWTVHSTGGLTGANAKDWTDAQWLEMLQGAVTEWTAITALYKSTMESYRTSTGPIPIVMYEVGFLYGNGGVSGRPEVQPIVERFMAFTKTTSYRTFLQDYVPRYLQANSVKLPCWFLQSGEWESTANFAYSHGMKRAPHLADTPGKTYWKSITL